MDEVSPLPSQLLTDLFREVRRLSQRVDELTAENTQLRQRVDDLTTENSHLHQQLEEAQTQAARQAAPFRRPERKKIPADKRKKPGRPPGHPGTNRPIPSHVDQTIEVPLPACPNCGSPVVNCQECIQYVEDIPPVRPHVTKLTTYTGICPKCGDVRSIHPLQTGFGQAASQVHLGPRALAVAATLSKQHGLTMRKTCRVLEDTRGLKLSPGGLSQALDRIADRVESDYQALFADLRAGPAAYVDETSWWVGGPGQWLWVFTNPTTTLYQVRDSRSRAVVTDVLNPDYAGVLVSDCLNIYDGVPFPRKHKCIAHHQKAIREQLDSPGLGDRTYLQAWKSLFTQVCAVWHVWEFLPAETRLAVVRNSKSRIEELLSREVIQVEDVRIRNRLEKQRAYLLGCLECPESVEPTNNRAERALRPAVIARKVSCGNKTDRGKRTWQQLASLLTTWAQRGLQVVNTLAKRCPLPAAG